MKFKQMKMIFPLLFMFTMAYGQNYQLKIVVENIEEIKGKLYLQVVDTKEKPVKQVIKVVDNKVMTIDINDLPEGKFAVRIFQDINNNGKMDTGMFGIPKEPWGLSNNVKAIFGPPKFSETLFDLKANKTISIKLQ